MGLATIVFAPIEFRGVLLEYWAGIPLFFFGLIMLIFGLFRKDK